MSDLEGKFVLESHFEILKEMEPMKLNMNTINDAVMESLEKTWKCSKKLYIRLNDLGKDLFDNKVKTPEPIDIEPVFPAGYRMINAVYDFLMWANEVHSGETIIIRRDLKLTLAHEKGSPVQIYVSGDPNKLIELGEPFEEARYELYVSPDYEGFPDGDARILVTEKASGRTWLMSTDGALLTLTMGGERTEAPYTLEENLKTLFYNAIKLKLKKG